MSTGTLLRPPPLPPAGRPRPLPTVRARLRALPPALVVLLAVAASVAVRLPFLGRPLSPDEGGFLMVAGQWHHGTSLYGDYWVDRPPLLIGLFRLAGLVGGPTGDGVALRVLGIVAVVAAVLLAALVGRLVAPTSRWAPVLAAVTAAVFLCTPQVDALEVNGELLAVPLVLAGIAAVVRAAGTGTRGWWLVAGVLATCAGAVKQSMLEVYVVAAVGLLVTARIHRRRAVTGTLLFAAGALAALGALLAWAASRGTTPAELWDAVVTFRAQASEVIAHGEPERPRERAVRLLLAFATSGAPLLMGLAAVPARRGVVRPGSGPSGTGAMALAVLAWEAFAVLAGGSYWLHYLVGLVPGLVLAVAVIARRHPRRLRWVAAVLALSAVLAVTELVVAPQPHVPASDGAAADYLADHARPGDTAVVAFGNPEILHDARLPSPYPELWSLPVRVRDPHLTAFTRVLEGPARTTWVVVDGPYIDTWAVDGRTADAALARGYRVATVVGHWYVYHRT